jgi:heme exporter protein D
MDGFSAFLSMGGYGGFVWPSYAIAVIVLVGLLVQSQAALRRYEGLLRQLRAARRGGSADGIMEDDE